MDWEQFDKTQFLYNFAHNLKKIRMTKGYSQDKLTLECGLSKGTISKIETGLVDPHISTLIRISLTLGIDPGKLLGL